MKKFEKNILNQLLINSELSNFVLPENINESVEFSGTGYFVTIKSPLLPRKRIVLDKPNISGNLGGTDVGYLAFVEDSELMLECYSLDKEILPENRNQDFVQT